MDDVKKKLFSISLSGRAAQWYKLLKNGRSLCWEKIVPLFYSKFYSPSEIHQDRTLYIISGLMMEKLLPNRGED